MRQSSRSYVGRQNVCWVVRNGVYARGRQKVRKLQCAVEKKRLVLAKKKIKRLKGKHDKLVHSEKHRGNII